MADGRKRKAESEEIGEKKPRLQADEETAAGEDTAETLLYKKFYARRLSEDGLHRHCCPLPDDKIEGKIKPRNHPHGSTAGLCKRCKTPFDVSYDSKVESCKFHTMPSKKNRQGRQMPHGCCYRQHGSTGCKTAPKHVHESNHYTDVTGFRQTASKNKEGKQFQRIYCLDTESIHTKKGLEMCRVTALDRTCKVVYETLCRPTSEIIDYNTIWSGLTKADLDDVTKTFSEVQDDLLELIDEKTVLVGHCISSDLIALKMIHKTVVETQDLYPHERGFPFRRGLKELARNVLGRIIQSGDGHDSNEDAEVTMKLALRAVGA